MTKRFLMGALSLAFALSGCDDGDGDSDAGPDVDGGGMLITDPPPEIEAYTETPDDFAPATIDLSCLGTRTAPTGAEDVAVEFQLRDFQDDFEVPDIEVDVFTNNVITDSCALPNCQAVTTNSMGNATVMMPAGGWYAYRVNAYDDPNFRSNSVFQVFQYNEPAPTSSGGSVIGQSVSGYTIDIIPALLGFTREEGRAIIAGRVHDCNDANIANARVLAFDPEGNYLRPTGRSEDAADYYFAGVVRGNVPDVTALESRADGLYLYPQVLYIDDRPYRFEAWATVGGELTRIGCETARVFTNSVTILNIGPLRADGAAECAD